MSFDFNDAEPQKSGELIPDGTFAKVSMKIRPGGIDGQSDVDIGLLKASNSPDSDVQMLDCEITVLKGPHARRKLWQLFTVTGGKVDEHGVSKAWKISKSTFRAMIDSALGLDPEDMSDAAKAKRQLRGLADLNGIEFVAKVMIEPNRDPQYSDQNKLDRVILPNESEWKKVMDGEDVPPSPSRSRKANAPASAQRQPAWNQNTQPSAPAAATPAWQAAPVKTSSPPGAPAAAQPTAQAANGPAWLNE